MQPHDGESGGQRFEERKGKTEISRDKAGTLSDRFESADDELRPELENRTLKSAASLLAHSLSE